MGPLLLFSVPDGLCADDMVIVFAASKLHSGRVLHRRTSLLSLVLTQWSALMSSCLHHSAADWVAAHPTFRPIYRAQL